MFTHLKIGLGNVNLVLTKLNLKRHISHRTQLSDRHIKLFYNNLVKHATAKNKQLDLTFEEFKHFTQYEKCHYCYSPIFWTKNNLAKNGSKYNLDRKDNNLGYTFTNLVPCCWRCNNARGALYSYEEWFGMTEFFRKSTT